jgi:hypothetical protein
MSITPSTRELLRAEQAEIDRRLLEAATADLAADVAAVLADHGYGHATAVTLRVTPDIPPDVVTTVERVHTPDATLRGDEIGEDALEAVEGLLAHFAGSDAYPDWIDGLRRWHDEEMFSSHQLDLSVADPDAARLVAAFPTVVRDTDGAPLAVFHNADEALEWALDVSGEAAPAGPDDLEGLDHAVWVNEGNVPNADVPVALFASSDDAERWVLDDKWRESWGRDVPDDAPVVTAWLARNDWAGQPLPFDVWPVPTATDDTQAADAYLDLWRRMARDGDDEPTAFRLETFPTGVVRVAPLDTDLEPMRGSLRYTFYRFAQAIPLAPHVAPEPGTRRDVRPSPAVPQGTSSLSASQRRAAARLVAERLGIERRRVYNLLDEPVAGVGPHVGPRGVEPGGAMVAVDADRVLYRRADGTVEAGPGYDDPSVLARLADDLADEGWCEVALDDADGAVCLTVRHTT